MFKAKLCNLYLNRQNISTIINVLDHLLCLVGVFFNRGLTDIPMGTNCVILLTDLFYHAYKADFIQMILKKTDEKSFNIIFRFTCIV